MSLSCSPYKRGIYVQSKRQVKDKFIIQGIKQHRLFPDDESIKYCSLDENKYNLIQPGEYWDIDDNKCENLLSDLLDK